MRRVILMALALFVGAPAFAIQAYRTITASGGAPIPTAFSASDTQSLVLDNLVASTDPQACVWNGTASSIGVNHELRTGTPASTDVHRLIPPNTGRCFQYGGRRIFIESLSGGTITSGFVSVDAD